MKDQCYISVLNKINEIRKLFNLESLQDLPKGYRESENSCPIAIALHEVDSSVLIQPDNIEYRHLNEKEIAIIACVLNVEPHIFYHNLPLDITQFIDDFDMGKYPELELSIDDQQFI